MFYLKCRDLKERTELIDFLKARNIFPAFHYVPLHSSPAGLRFGRAVGSMRVTDADSDRLVRLPLYYDMPKDDALFVSEAVKEYYGQR